MKKTLLICIAALVATACTKNETWKYGQGGINARQYVKEKTFAMSDVVESMEVTEEDSLLTDVFLTSNEMAIYKDIKDYYDGKIKRAQLDSTISEAWQNVRDVEWSWMLGGVFNDSLRHLDKYEYCWRKAYTVRVTFKSGVVKEPRVLMDADGITPYCMESDIIQSVKRHASELLNIENGIVD